MRPVLPLLLSLSLCAPTLADWSGPIEQPLWSLPAAPGLSRWLIVHNLSSCLLYTSLSGLARQP